MAESSLLLYPEEEDALLSRPAALPFVTPIELVWTSMVGEPKYGFGGYDWAGGLCAFRSKAEENIVCGNWAAGGFTFSYLKELSTGYIQRALLIGARFFRGSGRWGCTEYNVLVGINALIENWISDLKAVEALMRSRLRREEGSVPVFLRQYDNAPLQTWPQGVLDKTQALRLELEWADTVLRAMRNAISVYEHAESAVPGVPAPKSVISMYEAMRTVGAYASGAYNKSFLSAFDQTGTDPSLPDRVVGFFENAAKKYVVQLADKALEEVRGWVLKTAEDMGLGKAIEGAVSGLDGFLGSQVAGPFFENLLIVVQGVADALREKGPEKFFRGEFQFHKKDVEWYMVMSFRAYQQAIHRAAMLLSGTHPVLKGAPMGQWQPGIMNVVIGAEGTQKRENVVLPVSKLIIDEGGIAKETEEEVPVVIEPSVSPTTIVLGLGAVALLGYFLLRK